MSNNRSVRQYYRHIVERRPGIKGKRKGDYRPKLANGVSSQNGNGKRKETDTKKIKPTITNKGTSHFSIGELILLLNDEQLARLFIYCYTQKGLNAPLPVNAMLGVLNNMSKVAKGLAQCEIIDRLKDSLDTDSANYSEDILKFEREFRTIDMGDRLRMADEIGTDISATLIKLQTLIKPQKRTDLAKVYFIFREWISKSFQAELAIPHKYVRFSDK